MFIKPLLVAGALAVGGLTACHSTNPSTVCNEYKNTLNNAAGRNQWSVANANEVLNGTAARCLLRDNATFATACRIIIYEDHSRRLC